MAPKQARLNIVFFSADSNRADSMHIDTVLMRNGQINRLVQKFEEKDSTGHMRFYMDPVLLSFWLVFRHSGKSDSVWFSYKARPAFISESCGYYNRYFDLYAELGGASRFKSVSVVNPMVDTANTSHVKIYF